MVSECVVIVVICFIVLVSVLLVLLRCFFIVMLSMLVVVRCGSSVVGLVLLWLRVLVWWLS